MRRRQVEFREQSGDRRLEHLGSPVEKGPLGGGAPDVFARNLDLLSRWKRLSRKEVAEKSGVPRQWFRRIVTRGLRRVTERNRHSLRALAKLFGLHTLEQFWESDLIVLKDLRFAPESMGPPTPTIGRQVEFRPYQDKLIELL